MPCVVCQFSNADHGSQQYYAVQVRHGESGGLTGSIFSKVAVRISGLACVLGWRLTVSARNSRLSEFTCCLGRDTTRLDIDIQCFDASVESGFSKDQAEICAGDTTVEKDKNPGWQD